MKRVSPKSTVQYLLRIAKVYDERTNIHSTRLIIETTQSFATFVYDLIVREQRNENRILLKIDGLKPPKLSIPASGHARFETLYDDLNGTYEIVVKGIDGKTDSFSIQFSGNTIKLLHAPKDGFVDLIIEPSQQ